MEETKTTEETGEESTVNVDKVLLDVISNQYDKADTSHKEIRDTGFTFNDREELFLQRYKESKEDTESVLSTGELTTLAIDGSCRVMAQLPSGRFYNYNGKTGANMIMNLYFKHAVVRNANTGGPLLMKYRMVDMYSRVFPYIPCFIDWKVTDKYTGPDLIVIHPRRFRPQPGKTAIEDMDYCFIDTEVSTQWLEEKLKQDSEGVVFKNIQNILDSAKDEGTGAPVTERSPDQSNKTKTGITLRHKLSSNGDWQVWAPFDREDLLLVNEKKWFPGIPISIKIQYPSMDKLGGITDFDRGEKNQKSIDRLVRNNEDNSEMMTHPPLVMDPEDVVLSSIVRKKKAKWFVKNSKVDSIKTMTISPQGMNTFQSTYQIYKGNMLSMGAQTDTAVSASIDPGMGKTPEALRQQGSKQGARDAWDISMVENFIDRTHTIMANMIAMKGINEYSFNLFGESIKKIKDEYPDEDLTMFGEEFENGLAKVDPKLLEGEYVYISDEGSTLVKNDDTGVKMMNYIEKYNKFPGIQEDFAEAGQKFNQGEAFKRAMLDDGIKDAEKIIVMQENPESVAGVGEDGATAPEAGMMPEDPGMPPEAPIVPMPPSMPLMPDNQPIIAQ
ncbi:MAG: hypothetical protein WC823_00195 [Parcubacteria group bacterium]|jgi:hypothetical protein